MGTNIFKNFFTDETKVEENDGIEDSINIEIPYDGFDDSSEDSENMDFEEGRQMIVATLTSILNDEKILLNQNQKNEICEHIKRISECNYMSHEAVITNALEYIDSLYPFIFIHDAMKNLKEAISINEKINDDIKLKINNLISIVNNSNDLDELRYNLNELKKYTVEKNISIDFASIYSGLEKEIDEANKEIYDDKD